MTSSLRYPQSNGKAENAIKTVKRLFKKCKDAGQSEFLALLDWRITPAEGIGTSPAQHLMGRRCRALLAVAANLLKPRYDTEADTQALVGTKQRQQYYYNRAAAKPLKTITSGETVRMKLPGQDTWSPGTCTEKLENSSYVVKVGNAVYRRNCRHIQKTNEASITVLPKADQVLPTSSEDNLATPPDPSSEAPLTDREGNTDLRRSNCIR